MTTQALTVSLIVTLMVDGLLMAALLHYYRRLEFTFLKFASAAMLASVVTLCAHIALVRMSLPSMTAFESIALLLYAILVFSAAAHLCGRRVPLKLVLSLALIHAVHAIIGSLLPGPESLHRFAEALVPALLLGLSSVTIFRYTNTWMRRLLATLLLTDLLFVLAVGYSDSAVLYVCHALLVTASGFAFLITGGDDMLVRLQEQNDELHESRVENRRLELQFTQAQKLESLGVLAGGIAHDFNNMLTSILGYASLAMKKLPATSEVRKDLYMVMSGARQAVDLTSQMLIYAGKGVTEFESLDVSRVVDGMASLINSVVPRKVKVVNRIGRDLPQMRGDQVQLGQVLMNLVANAVDAIEDVGTVEIATGLTEVNDQLIRRSFFTTDISTGAYLYLSVRDTGVGLEPDKLERIFDPFFSEKGVSKGLGLSSISGIVRQHKGFVKVESAPGKGAEFTIYFPALTYEEATPAGTGRYAGSGGQLKGNILLADDDPRIRGLIQSILESDHFQLTTVEDGKEALKMVTSRGADYVLFLLDCTMPKMSGTEVYRQIRAKGLTTPVILISGYHQDQVINNISSDENAHFIKKPFNVDELLGQVDRALSDQVPG